MHPSILRKSQSILFSDLGVLILVALGRVLVQLLTSSNYGWHRDELAFLDEARHLAWGYVAYPPLTPIIGRLGLVLFGPSMLGVRLFVVLAHAISIVLTGLMVRELGGRRFAQVTAALAVALSVGSLGEANLFQYVSFDYLWWVLLAYLAIRLVKSENPRWWLGIGAAIGLGVMTKYTIAFYLGGMAVGILLTRNRRYLLSPWLYAGAGIALLICLPNLVWQAQHGFVSLTFLNSIHTRDVSIGRANSFYTDQLLLLLNPLTIGLALGGLYFTLLAPAGQRYRVVGWMYIVTMALFAISQGRGYYTMPLYPMLVAGGAYWADGWLSRQDERRVRWVRGAAAGILVVFGLAALILVLPWAPVGTPLFEAMLSLNGDLREEFGWPELTQTVATIYQDLPAEERAVTGILAGNSGEAGAINLYGPAYGLPQAISGMNSYWYRGYGNPPPQTLIVMGYPSQYLAPYFESCRYAGQAANPYKIENEETRLPGIFICRVMRQPWPEFWITQQHFG
jgi:4-amino-4-deoxy-L-arabinose transferase-like glycosyltransferase